MSRRGATEWQEKAVADLGGAIGTTDCPWRTQQAQQKFKKVIPVQQRHPQKIFTRGVAGHTDIDIGHLAKLIDGAKDVGGDSRILMYSLSTTPFASGLMPVRSCLSW